MTRKISDEEKKLWKYATKGVKGEGVEIDDFLAEPAKVKITLKIAEDAVAASRPAKRAAKELVAGKVNAMDGNSFKRLFKGRQEIEARIDLHGMWVSEAQIAVRTFIEKSRLSGLRCVLVITGKGGIRGDGKIKSEFPKWLNDADIRPHVLSFTHATNEHGGAGAFYVYLRK